MRKTKLLGTRPEAKLLDDVPDADVPDAELPDTEPPDQEPDPELPDAEVPDEEPSTKQPATSPIENILILIGEQIELARKRRGLSQERFASDLNMSRSTLKSIEKGKPGIALSTYIPIFLLMGKHFELIHFASTDLYGRKLQDERLLARKHKLPAPDPYGV